jgi:beta-1,2-mannobiose phosphorylase / 1,2-beta-oligomannan phosphorylase
MKNQLELSVQIDRLPTIVAPDSSNFTEAHGMINPASLVTRQRDILVYPRAVEKPNISRMARVQLLAPMQQGKSFLEALRDSSAAHRSLGLPNPKLVSTDKNGQNRPNGENRENGQIVAKRLGNGLVPRAPFEFRSAGGEFGVGYGVEDPRITYMPDLDLWVCCYTAFGPQGPRCAMAYSKDGWHWRRLGLVNFASALNLNGDDKDGVLFPRLVRSPQGMLSFAYYHRPMHPLDLEGSPDKYARVLALPAEERDCMRIAYIPAQSVLDQVRSGKVPASLLNVYESHIVLPPNLAWGRLKNGAGTPPILTKWGYVSFFHGVDAEPKNDGSGMLKMLYRGGIIVHDQFEPHKVKYVSPEPILSPESAEEKTGVVDNVVFPTSVTQFSQDGEPAIDVPVEQQSDPLTVLVLWGAGDFVTNGGLVTFDFRELA